MSYPGDNLIDSPHMQSSRKMKISAAVSEVWPWVIQMGQGRGGFYSYSFLENLIGCKMKNATVIHPEWQNLNVGDTIAIHPKANPLHVAQKKENEYLVFSQNKPFPWTWAFCLEQDGKKSCQLVVRTRVKIDNWIGRMLARPAMFLGHGMMERKMLKGIKQRAESAQS